MFSNFTHDNISEHCALQTDGVSISRGYIVCLRTGGPFPVAPAMPAHNMLGMNSGTGPLYRIDLWNDAGALGAIMALQPSPAPRAALIRALRNTRWPVFCCMTVGGINVVLVTVHLDLKANWLEAVVLQGAWTRGLKECLELFLQHSTWYANALAWMGPNGSMIIAGDLNASPAEIAQPNVLLNFDGFSHNLSHILAHSPN